MQTLGARGARLQETVVNVKIGASALQELSSAHRAPISFPTARL